MALCIPQVHIARQCCQRCHAYFLWTRLFLWIHVECTRRCISYPEHIPLYLLNIPLEELETP